MTNVTIVIGMKNLLRMVFFGIVSRIFTMMVEGFYSKRKD